MSANDTGSGKPSPWLLKHLPEFPASGQILDLACGRGRHARYLLGQGFDVTAVDINTTGVEDLKNRCTVIEADLESGEPWPIRGQFDGILVFNYLYRPGFTDLLDCLKPGGLLLYETFMVGNEAYGRPSNPNFLLRVDELKRLCEQTFTILNFNQGFTADPGPAMKQSICARKHL